MNVIFAGTPAFALPTLERLHAAGHALKVIYTQPDRAAGRGRQLRTSPIKDYALTNRLPLRQPATLRGEGPFIGALDADVMVVVAYGLLLPASILALPRFGCINVHASLLPRWRGAAPVARAVEAGDQKTGITIMQMETGLDTGPILLQRDMPIFETDTTGTLEQRLAILGAETLIDALERLRKGALVAQPQDGTQACYAPKLQKDEAWVDWSQPALQIHRKIRALNPRPVAATRWRGETLRLWEVGPLGPGPVAHGEPGTVVEAGSGGVLVQTGAGVLNIQRLQLAGGRALAVREFLNGTRIAPGDQFGT